MDDASLTSCSAAAMARALASPSAPPASPASPAFATIATFLESRSSRSSSVIIEVSIPNSSIFSCAGMLETLSREIPFRFTASATLRSFSVLSCPFSALSETRTSSPFTTMKPSSAS